MGVLFLSLYNIHQPALPPTGNVPALQEEKSPGEVRALPVLFLCMIRILLGKISRCIMHNDALLVAAGLVIYCILNYLVFLHCEQLASCTMGKPLKLPQYPDVI